MHKSENSSSKWLFGKPSHQGLSTLLFTACDSGYLNYALSLIQSVECFSPNVSIVLHLINPDSTALKNVKKFVLELKEISLFVSFETTDLDQLTVEQQKAYYACARFIQIEYLLKEFGCSIFSLDADSLVVNEIDFNFSDKSDAEIVLLRRESIEDSKAHMKVATGSIWFKPTESVFTFLKAFNAVIQNAVADLTIEWFIDQVTFYKLMTEMGKQLHVYNLKSKYADWEFKKNSIVWAGKGPRKENDIRFFLLTSLLSFDESFHASAQHLWSDINRRKLSLANDVWFKSQIEKVELRNTLASTPIHHTEERKYDIYIPRLDLPWKKPVDDLKSVPRISEDVLDLRLYWKKFAISLANVLESEGKKINVIELPAWLITRELIDASGASVAFVPHRCFLDFPSGRVDVYFYMQEFYRWVFVINKSGWSAASDQYPFAIEGLPSAEHDSFLMYMDKLKNGQLNSKFSQQPSKSLFRLLKERIIPTKQIGLGLRLIPRNYIFFPLQIPTDQSIQYFSDYEELEVVRALVKWATEHKVAVVLKPHPANMKSMKVFKTFVDESNIFWSTGNLNDLIKHASAVFTINSGVGFESLLHLKPVVTFGRVEYDCVTFHATPSTLDDAWSYCQNSNVKSLKNKYSMFFNYFFNHYAIDLSHSDLAQRRLSQVVSTI